MFKIWMVKWERTPLNMEDWELSDDGEDFFVVHGIPVLKMCLHGMLKIFKDVQCFYITIVRLMGT